MVTEVMGEMDKISDGPDVAGRPIPFYIMHSATGEVSIELVYLYMFGGVPFILDPGIVVSGTGMGDAVAVNRTGEFIKSMFMNDNDHAYSIGYVDSMLDAYDYAVKFTASNVPSEDTGIDQSLVTAYVSSHPDTLEKVGSIQRVGGTMFDVYAISSTESAMFRPNKDFMGGEPFQENDTDGIGGRFEVLLVGGNPDIVPVGTLTSMDGWMFTAWVPNEAKYIDCARWMFRQDDIPHDVLYVDELELEQAYYMLAEKIATELSEGDMGNDESGDETDVPDFDYEAYYSSDTSSVDPG